MVVASCSMNIECIWQSGTPLLERKPKQLHIIIFFQETLNSCLNPNRSLSNAFRRLSKVISVRTCARRAPLPRSSTVGRIPCFAGSPFR